MNEDEAIGLEPIQPDNRDGKVIMADIQKAINTIPEKYKKTFKFYLERYKYEEIAHKTGLPLGTVKTHIRSVKGLLKKYLGQLPL